MKFIEHQGMQYAIRGHVLIVREKVLERLQRFAYAEVDLPWAFSEEGDMFQLSHPLTMEERVEFKWLYHRMEALAEKETAPEPEDDGPGPVVA